MTEPTDTAGDGYDIFSDDYRRDPHPQWAVLRENSCPVAHSGQWGGSWMVVKYADIRDIAQDPGRFSSRAVEVAGPIPRPGGGLSMPPLTSSPPDHRLHRNLLLPHFVPSKVATLEPFVRAEARRAAEAIATRGEGDAVGEFARPLALAVLTHLLDVPRDMQERFVDWVTRLLRLGPQDQQVRKAVIDESLAYLDKLLDERSRRPGDDLISFLAHATLEGQPLSRKHQLGSLFLLVLAGADTTWNTIGASIWHLARNPADRARLRAEPRLLQTTAVEEFLRVYAPVSVARITTEAVELHGRCVAAQERVILPLAAANRDPEVFEDPDVVKLDRQRNPHLTFNSGIHRCLGSNLARLEVRVALEEWLRAVPDFEATNADSLEWSGGNVRGPERVPVRVTR